MPFIWLHQLTSRQLLAARYNIEEFLEARHALQLATSTDLQVELQDSSQILTGGGCLEARLALQLAT